MSSYRVIDAQSLLEACANDAAASVGSLGLGEDSDDDSCGWMKRNKENDEPDEKRSNTDMDEDGQGADDGEDMPATKGHPSCMARVAPRSDRSGRNA